MFNHFYTSPRRTGFWFFRVLNTWNSIFLCTQFENSEATFSRIHCFFASNKSCDVLQAECFIMASQPTPHMYPSRNKGFIQPYQGKPMVKKPLTGPYFWGGTLGVGWLAIISSFIVFTASKHDSQEIFNIQTSVPVKKNRKNDMTMGKNKHSSRCHCISYWKLGEFCMYLQLNKVVVNFLQLYKAMVLFYLEGTRRYFFT